MGKVIKVIMGLLFLVVLAYLGTCVYANFVDPGSEPAGNPDLPDVSKAPYAIVVENTGNMMLTAKYERHGNVLILHGYWEVVGRSFKYRDRQLVMDQAVFGSIVVTKR